MSCVFVDLDGTLADSLTVLWDLYCDFMDLIGREGTREEFAELNGPSLPEVVAILQERYQIPGNIDELVGYYMTEVRRRYNDDMELYPGAKQFIQRVQAAGWKLCLVTSGERATSQAFLEQQGIADAFTAIVTSEDVECSKPDPAIYLKAQEIVGCSGIAIEDAPQGVQSAQAAGLPAIWLTHHDVTGDAPADIVAHVSSWAEVTTDLLGRCHV